MNYSTRGTKTTIEIPPDLLKRAKNRARSEHRPLRSLIIEGLELILTQEPKKGGSR